MNELKEKNGKKENSNLDNRLKYRERYNIAFKL